MRTCLSDALFFLPAYFSLFKYPEKEVKELLLCYWQSD